MSKLKNLLLSAVFAASAVSGPSCNVSPKTKVNHAIASKKVSSLEDKVKGQKTEKNQVVKYALVIGGSSRGERGKNVDPLDKNFFWLATTKVYGQLERAGFKPENIYFFYDDGRGDFSETLNRRAIEDVKRYEFNRPRYKRMATIKNVKDTLDMLAKKVDDNDVFMMIINTHGSPNVIEMYDSYLFHFQLNRMVSKVKPGFGLLLVDACHSGAYIGNINLKNYVIMSGTGRHTYGWGDRFFSVSSYFTESLNDPESDTNVDGKITIDEAFKMTVKKSKNHWKRIRKYLLTRYKWGEPTSNSPEENIKEVSVVPLIKTSDKKLLDFYIVDLWPFLRR